MIAAITAARQNKSVLLLEQLPSLGAKLKATGGGRCNLSNTLEKTDFMNSFGRNGRFMTEALTLFDYKSLVTFLEEIGVQTHIPDGFRIFPITHNSATIITALENELKKQNLKLYDTIQNLESTQESLTKAEKMANLGELVGGVTHEINTPLGISITISSHIESITADLKKLYNKDNMTQEDFENYTVTIEENIKTISISLNRVATMLNSFRDIALDQVIEEKRVFVFKDYIDEILISLKNKTKKFNHKITVNIDKGIVMNSYPGYFYQIITNFINNSYLHGFEGIESGEILIQVAQREENIILTYSDNGVGIKDEFKKNIFKEYFTTKRGKGGTGLGLSIVNNLITNKLNGTIEIFTEEQKGLKFILTIPK